MPIEYAQIMLKWEKKDAVQATWLGKLNKPSVAHILRDKIWKYENVVKVYAIEDQSHALGRGSLEVAESSFHECL